MPTLSVGIVLALVATVASFASTATPPVQRKEETPIIQDWQKKGFLAALTDPSVEVLKSAIPGLDRYEEIAAILPALVEAPDFPVSRVADLLEDNDVALRKAVVEAVGKVGVMERAPAIAERLKDENSDVCRAAIEALGALGAKEQAPAIAERLKDENPDVCRAAIEALGALGAKEQTPAIAERLKDENSDVRGAAIEALGALGAKEQVPAIAGRLKDEESYVRRGSAALKTLRVRGGPVHTVWLNSEVSNVRRAAVEALVKLGPLDLAPILHVLGNSYHKPDEAGYFLCLAHFLGGAEQTNERVISWLSRRPANIAIPVDELTVNPDEARATLAAFKEAWDLSKDPQLRQDLASNIALLVHNASWEESDLPLLKKHEQDLREGGFAEADTVQRVLGGLQTRNRVETAGGIWAAHAAFWLCLIALYPRFPQVQAIFFWNTWVRRLVGLGYVGFLLTWVPPLRAILLAPFKDSLLADANLDGFDRKTYFEDSPVRLKTSEQTQAITSAIPEIRGQLVLEGESGLGKTMFLRHLAQLSKRTLAYLPATKCASGVLEAIQSRLHGYAKDETFLRSLIYSGAIDVCIDGLNEASPDARAQVTGFKATSRGISCWAPSRWSGHRPPWLGSISWNPSPSSRSRRSW